MYIYECIHANIFLKYIILCMLNLCVYTNKSSNTYPPLRLHVRCKLITPVSAYTHTIYIHIISTQIHMYIHIIEYFYGVCMCICMHACKYVCVHFFA